MRHLTLSAVLFGLASVIATSTVGAETLTLTNLTQVDAADVMGPNRLFPNSSALSEAATVNYTCGAGVNGFIVTVNNCSQGKAVFVSDDDGGGWRLECGTSMSRIYISRQDATLAPTSVATCEAGKMCYIFLVGDQPEPAPSELKKHPKKKK
jgi:hypothetical protein